MRDKASTSETSCYVFLCHGCVVGGVVCGKELDLGDVVDMRLDKQVDFTTIRAFRWAHSDQGDVGR